MLLFGITPWCLRAQLGPFLSSTQVPQAQSEKEFDAYLDILVESDPQQIIRQVNRFASEFPESQLLGLAFEHQMLAYSRLNDWRDALFSGQKALSKEPNNVRTLLTLASVIPNGVSDGTIARPLLDQAQQYAQRAVKELQKMPIPHEILPNKWRAIKTKLDAQAEEALGEISLLKGDDQKAALEFGLAVQAKSSAQGARYWRLGIAYNLMRETAKAEGAFCQAMRMGPASVTTLAQKELAKIQSSSALKKKTEPKVLSNLCRP